MYKYKLKFDKINLTFLSMLVVLTCSLSGCASKRLPLEITKPKAARVSGITHIVRKNETLWRISKTYNVDLDRLVKANRIADKTKIHVGQTIIIPGAKKRKKIAKTNLYKEAGFIWPVKGKITSYFNEKNDHLINKGININSRLGANIVSSRAGKITLSAENLKGYGKTIIIEHANGFITVYTHNSKNLVTLNATVKQGELIAKAGLSGQAQQPTLHFQIRKNNKPQNPLHYLP